MSSMNNDILNRFFTRSIFKSLINENPSSIYNSIIDKYNIETEGISNEEIIKKIYTILSSIYRNEYFYKNTLHNKLLLGKHSLNTTTALTEIPVAKSKADFILINGKAVVYEIKTDLDNFNRINSQIADYYKAFNYVIVVTSSQNLNKLLEIIDNSSIGIYILTNRVTLKRYREPIANYDNLDLGEMFKVLRKKEYENILKKHYGSLPKVSQFEYYKICKEMFSNIDLELAYSLYLVELKQRSKINNDMYNMIPNELKFVSYFSSLNDEDYLKANNFLKNNYRR